MSKTTSIFVRVEPEIKEQAEKVLNKLGIPMSNAINIFLRQVILLFLASIIPSGAELNFPSTPAPLLGFHG